jgi:3-deoxy-D-manno-octulosonate 8-phosphate phosphatase (KDO 8-P phosphatase)
VNQQNLTDDIIARAKKIKLLLMDCDGVLTDGRLYFTESGEAMKVFHVRDGQGLVLWHEAGFRSGIISGRNSKIVEIRAGELGVEFVRQSAGRKLEVFEEMLAELNVSPEETAFVGDDVADVPLLLRVGLAVAVADAVKEAKDAAHFVTKSKGGRGAVREVTDLLLQANEK